MVSGWRRIGGLMGLFAAAAVAACGSDGGGDLGGVPDPAALAAVRSEPSGNGR